MRLLDRLTRSTTYQSLNITDWARQFSPGAQFTYQGNQLQAFTNQSHNGQVYDNNAVAFACTTNRLLLFSEARLMFQSLRKGRPGDLFATPELTRLETPWPGASTRELMLQAELDIACAGNSYWVPDGDYLMRLDPAHVKLVTVGAFDNEMTGYQIGEHLAGYAYVKDPRRPVMYLPEQVAHYKPHPNQYNRFLGMSWLNPCLPEVNTDAAINHHKQVALSTGANLGYVVSFDPATTPAQFDFFVKYFRENYSGPENAGKTLMLGGGADVKTVGQTFDQLAMKAITDSGEARIAACAGVPPVIVGLIPGLDSSTYCLPANELVWTVGGPLPIEDVRAGDEVWSFVDQGLSPRKVLRQGQTGEKQIYRIRTKNRVLNATGNHPILTRVPGSTDGTGGNAARAASTEWKNVEDLVIGDEIVEPLALIDQGGDESPLGPVDGALIQWLGAYTGDGSGASRGGFSMALPPDDRCRDYYEKLTLQVFPNVHIGHEPRAFRFASRAIGRYVCELGFSGLAKTKTLPAWLFGLKRELRLAFLAGLIDTDGSVDKRGVCKIQLANRHLIEQVKMLAISCGFSVSNLYEQHYDASVLPNPGLYDDYVAWAITISSARDVAEIPFSDWLYRERVEENTHRHKQCGHDAAKIGLRDLGFFKVCEITPGPVVPVFDIEVEDGHSFVAAGIVVHNSNYGQARRRLADATLRPLWGAFAAAFSSIVTLPGGARLWYDDRDISFLRDDSRDVAEIAQLEATTLKTLVEAGADWDKAVAAISSGDLTILTGAQVNLSVQLRPQGIAEVTAGEAPANAKDLAAVGEPVTAASNGKTPVGTKPTGA